MEANQVSLESRRLKPDKKKGSSRQESRGNSRKQRLTISLSENSFLAFNELKSATDADTDSEVVRNALRLHLALLRAYKSGKKLLVKDGDTENLIPVDLFAPE